MSSLDSQDSLPELISAMSRGDVLLNILFYSINPDANSNYFLLVALSLHRGQLGGVFAEYKTDLIIQ